MDPLLPNARKAGEHTMEYSSGDFANSASQAIYVSSGARRGIRTTDFGKVPDV